MAKHKLFLLDAMALIYRAHFAFINAPRKTKTGLNTSAVFGFTSVLLEIVTKENPAYIGVALDTSAPTFRHKEFTPYKAQRDETPEDLIKAIPYVYRMLKALNVPALFVDGFEADDVIGTISAQMPEDEFDVYLVTPDKDYAQLVKPNVFLYRPPGKFENGYTVFDRQKVIEKYGVAPELFADYLGLPMLSPKMVFAKTSKTLQNRDACQNIWRLLSRMCR
jgi:DNA polymerase I